VSSWVRLHFEHLRRWREYAEKICSAVRSLGIGGEVYVVGGVAEGRTTVLSDIYLLVVVDGVEEEAGGGSRLTFLRRPSRSLGSPGTHLWSSTWRAEARRRSSSSRRSPSKYANFALYRV